MADAHKSIVKRLKELGWSNYRLAELANSVKGIGKVTVYEFLAGKSKIESGRLDGLLELLGMDYRTVKPPHHIPESK